MKNDCLSFSHEEVLALDNMIFFHIMELKKRSEYLPKGIISEMNEEDIANAENMLKKTKSFLFRMEE